MGPPICPPPPPPPERKPQAIEVGQGGEVSGQDPLDLEEQCISRLKTELDVARLGINQ